MIANPTFLTLLWSALADSADGFVILLFGAGFLLFLPFRILRPLTPYLLAAVITYGLFQVIPAGVPFAGAALYLLVWTLTLPLLLISTVRSWLTVSTVSTPAGRYSFIDHSADWITLLAFGVSVLSLWHAKWTDQSPPWEPLVAGSVILAVFYLIYQIAPWQFLPLSSRRQWGQMLLYLSIGFLLLRAAFWTYTLFNAAVKERPGSFRIKGVVYASEMAQAWRFPRMQALISALWYYPVSLERMANPYPVIRDVHLLHEGIQRAEAFRLSLLQTENGRKSKAELLVDSILSFQALAEDALRGRYSPSSFRLERENLLHQIQGAESYLRGEDLFSAFAGYWYGVWEDQPMEHHWKMVEHFDPPYRVPGDHPILLSASQYCWIGDGFGWNILATLPQADTDNGNTIPIHVILGIVYHVKDQNPSEIIQVRPHVGLFAEPGKLIWITEREIFLEEVRRHGKHGPERSIMTGYRYSIENNRLINNGTAFQAVYTRNPEERPSFFTFAISLQVQ